MQLETPINTHSKNRRSDMSSLLLPILGVVIASIVAAFLFRWLLNMPMGGVASMLVPMGGYAFASIIVGIGCYWLGWMYSTSIRYTFILMTVIVGVLTLFNGWIAAQNMFVDEVVLKDTLVLLVFTTIIASVFGVMGFGRTSRTLMQLTNTTKKVAQGDLSVQVPIVGRDEVAKLGVAFNQMASDLRDAEQQRQELETMRRDLIAWVSHDLRTPLTSIRAMIEALNDGVVDDEVTTKRYYRTMLNDMMGLNTLIDDLFELAQLDAGNLDFEMQRVSLADLISDSVESFTALAKQRDVTLEGMAQGELTSVLMNSEKIGRVLNNLISNALKYTPDQGTIRVSAEPHFNDIIISVADSGAGFSADDLPRVFEKFYRGEEARTRIHGSSAGLGLSIAKGIVEAHGGEIWAENSAEGGAKITFTIPHAV